MDLRNSSEISSLLASKRRIILSTLSANQRNTPTKSYPRSTRCFSPDRMPGVSTMVTHFRTGLLSSEHWNLLRKAPPNFERGRNCLDLSTARAFPGMTCEISTISPGPHTTDFSPTCSFSPYITAVKASVVGSGPILMPGKSLSRRYLMKEVLPVEY